jgi:DNA-binding transcriptional ArsR family regulator
MSDANTTNPTPPVLDSNTVFSALANPTRRAILAMLCDGELLGTADFAKALGIGQGQASKNGGVLVEAGLVRRRGTIYQIVPGLQPVPGKRELELGHCLLRLDYKPA